MVLKKKDAYRYLITGDWQADSRNLGMIERAATRERELMTEHGVSMLIDMGDLKNPYDPLGTRIAFAMQDRFRDKDALVVKGNHDRLSQNDNDLTWFPLIGDSPSVTFVTRMRVIPHPGVTFYILPYSNNVDELRDQSAKLADAARKQKEGEKVLLFHCDLREADYGAGRVNLDCLSVTDLQTDAYDYCFGGHVHKPQEVIPGIAWYVGSPFCMDWGEANQEKRMLLYEPGVGVTSIPVRLPGLYDWDNAKEMPLDALQGSTVRFRVKAKDGTHYRALARKRRVQFDARFPGVRLHCTPEYEATEVTDYTFTQGNDAEKVRAYVAQKYEADKALTDYVTARLELATSARSVNTEGIRFIGAVAENYTSFESVKFDYRKRGIVVINGNNKDWPGRSNASGKTNLQDLIKVGMFGETGKGQSADAWASDTLPGRASVKLVFRNAQGQKIVIDRTRRPTGISITVDGEDKSAGLSGREKSGTQGLITELSGYDLRMLTNAVYIDQERAHKFLVGTRKEKSELLYKFQGLERFEEARKLVAADVKTAKETVERLEREELVIQTTLTQLNERIRLGAEHIASETTAHSGLTQHSVGTGKAFKKLEPQWNEASARLDKIQQALPEEKRLLILEAQNVASLRTRKQMLQERITTDRQTSEKARTAHATLTSELEDLRPAYDAAKLRIPKLEKKLTALRETAAQQNLDYTRFYARVEASAAILTSFGTGVCPTCKQDLPDAKAKLKQAQQTLNTDRRALADASEALDLTGAMVDQAQKAVDELHERISAYETREQRLNAAAPVAFDPKLMQAEIREIESKFQLSVDKQTSLERTVTALEQEAENLNLLGGSYIAAKTAHEHALAAAERSGLGLLKVQKLYDALVDQTTTETANLTTVEQKLKEVRTTQSIYTRAVECLDRKGIPAYLCGLLCPQLSKAAEDYARLFADDALQVVFEFTEGEFDCKVINGQGSNEVEALSTGEKATAALITAFALRSAAPKTNVLILDEPGRGLDELGQKQFAEALGALKSEFDTVLITTHEKAMETALPADEVLTVVKENRISVVT